MNSRQAQDVLVAGGGVVGACAALALARDGRKVTLVEAREPPPWRADAPDLRVYAFAPDNRALLDELGAWAPVAAARAHAYRDMRVWDAAGGGELHFSAAQAGRAELGHIVEHRLLVDRLWQALASEARVSRRCPAQVESFTQDDQGVVLRLDDGTSLRGGLLLAADGADSRLRTLAGLEVDAHDYGQRGLVAYVRTEKSHEDTAWQRFLPTGPLAFLPCGDGRCSIVWTLPDAEAERLLALDAATFCRELTRAFDARLGDVVEVSARVAFPLRRQLARHYVAGRLLLLGDAAHAVHPLAGQGVNLGLRDVRALRDTLRRAPGLPSPARLQRWERERRSDNAVAAHSFEAINGLFTDTRLLPTLLRGPALGLAGKIAPLGGFFLRRAMGL
jgi:2-octaprenyl-3-methyl-6-methoxy-1,4-benzoquinol hydroxylase